MMLLLVRISNSLAVRNRLCVQSTDHTQCKWKCMIIWLIGMVFTRSGKKGDLYVIVNGEEYGPMAKDIP